MSGRKTKKGQGQRLTDREERLGLGNLQGKQ
jgi:hypothetical protein